MGGPVTPRSSSAGFAAQAPWLIVGAGILAATANTGVWLGTRVAGMLADGVSTTPWSILLVVQAVQGTMVGLAQGASSTTVWIVAGVFVFAVTALLAIPAVWVIKASRVPSDPAMSMAKSSDVGRLLSMQVARDVRRLRPSLATCKPQEIAERDRGVALGILRPRGAPLLASWEDVILAIMAPRAGKTAALAVPTILDAPGWAVATSNKSDVWTATSQLRSTQGRVWTFDPQRIAFAEQTWWWDPLSSVTDFPTAQRLATHFIQEIRGDRGDKDFWSSAALDLLTSLLLAAAKGKQQIDVVSLWLNDSRSPEPVDILRRAGESEAAQRLKGRQEGAPETREGIYETARTAAAVLGNGEVMRWVTSSAGPASGLEVFNVEDFVESTDTLYLLSKDGAGAAAPLVAGLTDAVLRAATRRAERLGGRLDPPGVVVLDEAANVCRIADLPDLYSHLGSRGCMIVTILQSYKQGVRVWGEHGMDTLWSAATVKLVGAGLDDPRFADDVSRLIGEHDVDIRSYSSGDGKRTSSTSVRRQRILDAADVRALPKGQAILLATGARAALILLRPYFKGPRAEEIGTAMNAAQDELTARARAALSVGGAR